MLVSALYIIKGKIYLSVNNCERTPYRSGYVYKVTFAKKDGTSFWRNYSLEDVSIVPLQKTIKGAYRYRDSDKKYRIIETLHLYGFNERHPLYYGLEHTNGYIEYVPSNSLCLESSTKDENNKLLYYLKELSNLSQIGDNDDEAISLAQKYERCRFVFDGSLFAKYLQPQKYRLTKKKEKGYPLIFPFGCNAGQWEATKNAFSSEVSIIQGPPGTGKTQTILNIIANILVRGETVEVVSNNNSAVSNVQEKLIRDGYGFLTAMLGSNDNKNAFFASQNDKLALPPEWKLGQENLRTLRSEISEISSNLSDFFSGIENLAVVRDDINQYEFQLKRDDTEHLILPARAKRLASSKLFSLLFLLDDNRRRSRNSLKSRFLCWMYGFGVNSDRRLVYTAAIQNGLEEKREEFARISSFIEAFKPRYEAFTQKSKELFNAILYERFGTCTESNIYKPEDLYRNPQEFLNDYPVVLSTIFSATSNISDTVPFDYLIMDEASQADVAAGALALNCTRNAIIVGDDKQLPNVVSNEIRKRSDEIAEKYKAPAPYRFAENSFLSSVEGVFGEAPIAFLREHYRCEPRIIGFCNQQFYGGRLIPMTTQSESSSIEVIRTQQGNHARGTFNLRQAEEAVEAVRRLINQYPDIGIIVPYNKQADITLNLLNDAGFTGIPVSTVHKFQGREKDAIILCTVDNVIREFVDDPHLLNVAVSRARRHFTLIVNGGELPDGNIKDLTEYISYCTGDVKNGSIRSVFDLLYQQYSDQRRVFVRNHRHISEYQSEDLMIGLLDDLLHEEQYTNYGCLFQYPLRKLIPDDSVLTEEEKTYAGRSWTLVDFLIYNRATKQPVLVIEVDGMSFHKEGSEQWRRDRLKDSILRKSNVKLLRLPTNGSGELEKIKSAIIE